MTSRTIDHYDGSTGRLVLTMPREAGEECSTPGQPADAAVAYWLTSGAIVWHASERELRAICEETGAWEDCETAELDTIKGRVLWMAACDWRENDKDREDYADAMNTHAPEEE